MNRGAGTPGFLRDKGLPLLLFGGKGGVGKTTCAAAAAIYLAGRSPKGRFLLVSTDPAHSLADSLAGLLPPCNLVILELDTQGYLTAFMADHHTKLREIASRGTFLDDEDISSLLDLSLPGLDELIAFLEISKWVEGKAYDCIVVDTAPAGHALRLLSMPSLIGKWLAALEALLAKDRYMRQVFGGSEHRDELDAFIQDLSGSVQRMKSLLRDPARCRFVPVMLPEALSIRETSDLLEELNRLKVPASDILVNKLYPKGACPLCADEQKRQTWELAHLPETFSKHPLWGIPLYPEEVRGLGPLKKFWQMVSRLEIPRAVANRADFRIRSLPPRVEEPGEPPSRETKLLLFAGKGGVGKTTLACATAVRLARDLVDKKVLLFSTDPAHSLSTCLDTPIGPRPTPLVPGLTAIEIDAQAEFEDLKRQYARDLEIFLGALSPNLDLTFDREVMERLMDLSPPGLDEVMALTLIMEFLKRGTYDILILDSAPTGHLVRLLELPGIIDQWIKVFFNLFLKYKRVFWLPKVSNRLVQISKVLKHLQSLLKDPNRSSLYAVTILAEMAFEETKDLVGACERMGIDVPTVFLNLATQESGCSLCPSLNRRELRVRNMYQQTFSQKHHVLVYRRGEPRGMNRLGELGEALYRPRPEKSVAGMH